MYESLKHVHIIKEIIKEEIAMVDNVKIYMRLFIQRYQEDIAKGGRYLLSIN